MRSTTGFAHLEVRGLLISPHCACTRHQHESVCAMMLSCLSSKDLRSPNETCLLVLPNPLEITQKWHFILFIYLNVIIIIHFPDILDIALTTVYHFHELSMGNFDNIKYELWHLLYCNIHAPVTYYSLPSVCTGEISDYKQCSRSISETPRLTADIESIPQTGAAHCINTLP